MKADAAPLAAYAVDANGFGQVAGFAPFFLDGKSQTVVQVVYNAVASPAVVLPVLDADGNLYCTTENGGAYGQGTVFKLTPRPTGAWQETQLYSFNPNGGDGYLLVAR